jgi:site-specific DNA recombinase
MDKPTVLYCRVSSEKQKDNYSLDTQEQGCRAYAQRLGFVLYRDVPFVDSVTGATLERPALDEVIELARTGKIGSVVAYVQDRFARADALDVWLLTVRLLEWGVIVHACDTGPLIESKDFMSALPMLVRAESAKNERERIKKRTMDGRKARAADGKICAPFPKYGWDWNADRSNWLVNAEEAAVITQIFDWYLNGDERGDGMGVYKIANRLSEMRIPTKRDKMQGKQKSLKRRARYGIWTIGCIQEIVSNPAYCGDWYYNQRYPNSRLKPESEWIHVAVPPIISRETFEAARAKAASNAKTAKRNTQYPYLLRNRMTCACCGLTFLCVNRTPRMNIYFCLGQSANQAPDRKNRSCHGAFSAKEVDELVWESVKAMIKHPDTLMAGLRQRQAEKEAELQPSRNHLEWLKGKLDEVNRELQIVRERSLQWVEPDELAYLDERRLTLNAERKVFQAKVADQERRLAETQIGEIPPEKIAEFCASIQEGIDHFTFERKRLLIELLDIQVLVHRQPAIKRKRGPEGAGVLTISGFIPLPEIRIGSEESEGVFASPFS